MVLVKNLKFSKRSVLCKIYPKKVFGDVLVRKQAFAKKMSMILVKKLNFFNLLYLSKIDRERVFADVLDKKEAF